MKRAILVLALTLALVGCCDSNSRNHLHRIMEKLNDSDRNLEIQRILERLSGPKSDDADQILMDALHPDLRLYWEADTQSRQRNFAEFLGGLRARRDVLEFGISTRIHSPEGVIDVVVVVGLGSPQVWYFLRDGEKAQPLIRQAPGLGTSLEFVQYLVQLPEEERAHLEEAIAIRAKQRVQTESVEQPSP